MTKCHNNDQYFYIQDAYTRNTASDECSHGQLAFNFYLYKKGLIRHYRNNCVPTGRAFSVAICLIVQECQRKGKRCGERLTSHPLDRKVATAPIRPLLLQVLPVVMLSAPQFERDPDVGGSGWRMERSKTFGWTEHE